jgi:hypothetical protein
MVPAGCWFRCTPNAAAASNHSCLANEHSTTMWSIVSGSWSHRKQLSRASKPCLLLLSAVHCRRRTMSHTKSFTLSGAHNSHSLMQPGMGCNPRWSVWYADRTEKPPSDSHLQTRRSGESERTMSSTACQTYRYSATAGTVTPPEIVRTHCLSIRHC